jgi:hypothetical protein
VGQRSDGEAVDGDLGEEVGADGFVGADVLEAVDVGERQVFEAQAQQADQVVSLLTFSGSQPRVVMRSLALQ